MHAAPAGTMEVEVNELISRRRFFIGGAACLIAAPAIVRATSIMPVHATAGLEGFEITAPGAEWSVFRAVYKITWTKSPDGTGLLSVAQVLRVPLLGNLPAPPAQAEGE